MDIRSIIKLVAALILCQLAGFMGSLATTPSIPTWYQSIVKPSFTPPNWIFAPVWTMLYVLMGISLFLVWNKGLEKPGVKLALLFFFLQLALNILWSFLFFGLHSPLFAFIEIVFLWPAILVTILIFLPISKGAGYLLIPYLLWVSFAAVLNFSLWRLNT